MDEHGGKYRGWNGGWELSTCLEAQRSVTGHFRFYQDLARRTPTRSRAHPGTHKDLIWG